MRCYLHHQKEAVGICSVCGKGVCEDCAVSVSGVIYCRKDADEINTAGSNSRAKRRDNGKGFGNSYDCITIAYILFYIIGALTILAGIAAIIALGAGATTSGFSHIFFIASLPLALFAIICLVAGIPALITAYLLGKRSKVGGILGIIVSILLIPFFFFGILLIILLALGWKTLE